MSVEVPVAGPVGRVALLEQIDWTVGPGEHWALLGPNGSGKTTLLSLASATRHPTTGTVRVLGARLGRVDLRALRRRIGLVDGGRPGPERLDALTTVLTGCSGTIEPRYDRYGDAEEARARELLDLVGCGRLGRRSVRTLSQGEKARVRLARALAGEPELLLLDEPATGLDLPGREDLIEACNRLAASRPALGTVTVAHGLEELPEVVNRACLLRGGRIVASGAAGEVLTAEALSACFGRPLEVASDGGRYRARGARKSRPSRAAVSQRGGPPGEPGGGEVGRHLVE